MTVRDVGVLPECSLVATTGHRAMACGHGQRAPASTMEAPGRNAAVLSACINGSFAAMVPDGVAALGR